MNEWKVEYLDEWRSGWRWCWRKWFRNPWPAETTRKSKVTFIYLQFLTKLDILVLPNLYLTTSFYLNFTFDNIFYKTITIISDLIWFWFKKNAQNLLYFPILISNGLCKVPQKKFDSHAPPPSHQALDLLLL